MDVFSNLSDSNDMMNLTEKQILCHLCIFNSRGELLIRRNANNTTESANLWDLAVVKYSNRELGQLSMIRRAAQDDLGIEKISSIKFDRQIRDGNTMKSYFVACSDMSPTEPTIVSDKLFDVQFSDYSETIKRLRMNEFAPYDEALLKHFFDFGRSLLK